MHFFAFFLQKNLVFKNGICNFAANFNIETYCVDLQSQFINNFMYN